MINGMALDGVRVLDLSRLLPGPYCSMILADHGADVLAVEDGRFQEDGLFFGEINRNKRHMSLNLKTDEGLDIFYRLAKQADVVLEGFRPGVARRLGVDYATLSEMNHRLIYCSITGYGQTGPKRDEAGHDVNYLATAGVLDLIGEKGGKPSIPGVQIADIMGGAMQAAIGILLALHHREKSGKGQYIDISMTDGILGLLTLPRFFQQVKDEPPQRSNNTLSHRFGCYNTYQTADGRHVAIGAVENRFWKKICETLGASHYAPLQYSPAHRQEIIDWLQGVFVAQPLSHWQQLFHGLDVCFSVVAELDEVMSSPLFRERDMVCEYEGNDGRPHTTLGIPVKLSATPGTMRTPPASFGAHTDSVLEEMGFRPEQIAELRMRNVI